MSGRILEVYWLLSASSPHSLSPAESRANGLHTTLPIRRLDIPPPLFAFQRTRHMLYHPERRMITRRQSAPQRRAYSVHGAIIYCHGLSIFSSYIVWVNSTGLPI